jgi:hypothetical protein
MVRAREQFEGSANNVLAQKRPRNTESKPANSLYETGSLGGQITIFNCIIRGTEMGVFGRIFVELSKDGGAAEEIMIDAPHFKAHRTAASLLKKGLFPVLSGESKAS